MPCPSDVAAVVRRARSRRPIRRLNACRSRVGFLEGTPRDGFRRPAAGPNREQELIAQELREYFREPGKQSIERARQSTFRGQSQRKLDRNYRHLLGYDLVARVFDHTARALAREEAKMRPVENAALGVLEAAEQQRQ